ncbi:Uncharacterised protein [[Pasteurella] mairii]|uniref:Uncharacterized protein n=1 Tax=[Pasteurella] mairii TaxID=757 RepID=A0A379B5R3_9PAST|nr:Uncharacterised protein [[Pasteurella] mairii]
MKYPAKFAPEDGGFNVTLEIFQKLLLVVMIIKMP